MAGIGAGGAFESRAQLTAFIMDARNFLRGLALEPGQYDLAGAFGTLQALIIEAWIELDEQQKRFEEWIDAVSRVDERRLVDHGLVGASLALKMQAYSAASERIAATQRGNPLGRFVRKYVLAKLDLINTIGESLAAATGVGALILEFKKVLEGAIEFAGD